MNTNTLAAGLVGFLLGGLTVSIAAELERRQRPQAHARLQQPPKHRAIAFAPLRESAKRFASQRPRARTPMIQRRPLQASCRRCPAGRCR